MEDYELIKCKHCGHTKKRIRDRKFPNIKDQVWRGEDGLMWNGHKCGPCVQEINAARKRAKSERRS